MVKAHFPSCVGTVERRRRFWRDCLARAGLKRWPEGSMLLPSSPSLVLPLSLSLSLSTHGPSITEKG